MFNKKIEYEVPSTLEELKEKSVKLNFKGERPGYTVLDGKGKAYSGLTRLSIYCLFVDENLDAYLTYYSWGNLEILKKLGLVINHDYFEYVIDESDPQIVNIKKLKSKYLASISEKENRIKFDERISNIKDSIKPLSFYGLKYNILDIKYSDGPQVYIKSSNELIQFATIELEDSLVHVNLLQYYSRNPGSYEKILEKNIIVLKDTYGHNYALQFESSSELSKAILKLKEAGYIKGINNECDKFYEIEKKPIKVFIDKDKFKKNKKK